MGKYVKYVKVIECPEGEKHVWYYNHIGETFKVTDKQYNSRLYKILDTEKIKHPRTKKILGKSGELFLEKAHSVDNTFLTQFYLALEKGKRVRKQKGRKKLNFAVPLDETTLVELEELISKEFKTVTKTEFCRYAIEYCLTNQKFIKELKGVE